MKYAILVNMKKSKVKINTDYGIYECLLASDSPGYIVTCPSVQGVVTWGKNLAEAKKMAREAIELCIESKVQDNVKSGVAARIVSKRSVFA